MRCPVLVAIGLCAATLSVAAPPEAPAPPAPPEAPAPAARAWFGVFFGDAVDGGVQILEVVPNGPAARAGILSGDLVIRVDGKDVADRGDLSRALERSGPGDRVALTILRKGESKDATVVLGTRPTMEWSIPRVRVAPRAVDDGPSSAADLLGIELSEVPPDLRKHLGGPPDAGLLVMRVEPNGVAAKALQVGDLLVTAGGEAVGSEADLDRIVLRRSSGPMPLAGRRGKDGFSAEVALRLKSPEDRAREARARMLEATIRQLEARLGELKRELAALSSAP